MSNFGLLPAPPCLCMARGCCELGGESHEVEDRHNCTTCNLFPTDGMVLRLVLQRFDVEVLGVGYRDGRAWWSSLYCWPDSLGG
mmetsp:Transcript_109087/g.170594  ORF Transcript_109087/g.170594 Transcript_109087/m.170594 type:complete len:84 (-) Transcript_109087:361-612(-)